MEGTRSHNSILWSKKISIFVQAKQSRIFVSILAKVDMLPQVKLKCLQWALDAWSIELVDDGWKNNNETWIWEIVNRTNKLLQESEA
ncbi:hypothetical protein Tco_0986224 [Tanacetum coccineum]